MRVYARGWTFSIIWNGLYYVYIYNILNVRIDVSLYSVEADYPVLYIQGDNEQPILSVGRSEQCSNLGR